MVRESTQDSLAVVLPFRPLTNPHRCGGSTPSRELLQAVLVQEAARAGDAEAAPVLAGRGRAAHEAVARDDPLHAIAVALAVEVAPIRGLLAHPAHAGDDRTTARVLHRRSGGRDRGTCRLEQHAEEVDPGLPHGDVQDLLVLLARQHLLVAADGVSLHAKRPSQWPRAARSGTLRAPAGRTSCRTRRTRTVSGPSRPASSSLCGSAPSACTTSMPTCA
jgi:hypothetical protein